VIKFGKDDERSQQPRMQTGLLSMGEELMSDMGNLPGLPSLSSFG